ncbi:hypothetical protein BH10PSE17_BH10PSE17_32010 [soil metagenome]
MSVVTPELRPAATPAPRKISWSRPLARLSVGKKLLLIYLLDLVTVLFISTVLIHEKYLSIDFSRKERQGAAYIDAIRPAVIHLFASQRDRPDAEPDRDAIEQAEQQFGENMRSEELAAAFAQARSSTRALTALERNVAMADAGALITRVGNQSNLILDPDLDSYYTMSLVLLRYPALLKNVADLSSHLHRAGHGQVVDAERAELFTLEGQLSGIAKDIDSDHREAIAAATDGKLGARLAPAREKLAAALGNYLHLTREVAGGGFASDQSINLVQSDLVAAVNESWAVGCAQLERLIDERVHDFFVRMWLHLGASLTLLSIILFAVYYVAQQISRPLKHLRGIVDVVRRTGDHDVRARWDSQDEIGRVVAGFNEMLGQLDEHRRVQQELVATTRAAEAQQTLLEHMPVPLMVTSVPDHRILHFNESAKQWLGERRNDPWGESLDRATRHHFFQELADRDSVSEFEVKWRIGSDDYTWGVLAARRLNFQGQDAVVTAFAPITRIKALEQRLELLAKVFEASSEGIVLLDADLDVVSANPAFCRAGLLEAAEVVHKELECVMVDDQPLSRIASIWRGAKTRQGWRGEVTVVRRNDTRYPALAVVTAIRDSNATLTHFILSFLDITERKAREEQVRFLAHHDVLTRLPNRRVAETRLRDAIVRCETGGHQIAVLFIDLDRFKTINDSLGHQVGDELLQGVARRLESLVRPQDTVSRFGGDEFVVLLDGIADKEEATLLAQRLRVALGLPYASESGELNVSCSIGLAVCPNDARDMAHLMRHADAAMYDAKSAGRDTVRAFSDELESRAQQRLRIETQLRSAIARREFSLVYQPQVSTIDGGVTAVEALLRWSNAELGQVSPTDLIPIAEDSRQIFSIGAWVIDEACRQMAAWQDAGIHIDTMSVNLSGVQLLDPRLEDVLRTTLARYDLPPHRLELELTETTLMEGRGERLDRLLALRAMGVRLAIDDFGTGYSSLSYLSRLPISKVKIDRSLVVGMLNEPKDRAITDAIVALAHRLDVTVVAEGIESRAMVEMLRESGCDSVQGFHVGRPMRADVLAHWLEQSPTDTVMRMSVTETMPEAVRA